LGIPISAKNVINRRTGNDTKMILRGKGLAEWHITGKIQRNGEKHIGNAVKLTVDGMIQRNIGHYLGLTGQNVGLVC